MKNSLLVKFLSATLAAIARLSILTPLAHAALYHVEINTSALTIPLNSGNAPFSLDFQLNSGNTLNNNTAIITNFTFSGGGTPLGPANLLGGATGSLSNMVTLRDTNPFNEFFQSFTAGSVVAFDIALTQNVDAGPTPDAFAVAILDRNLFNIATSSMDGADTLLHADIKSAAPLTIAELNVASGAGSYGGVTIAAIGVPDTSGTLFLFGLALLGATAVGRRVSTRREN